MKALSDLYYTNRIICLMSRVVILTVFGLFFSLFLSPSAKAQDARKAEMYLGDYEIRANKVGSVYTYEEIKYIETGSAKVIKKRTSTTNTWVSIYYHTNHQGSTSVVTASNGRKDIEYNKGRLRYFPYGEQITSHNINTQAVTDTYTGQKRDTESNLMFYNARLYNQKTGLFMQADSVNDGLNRYAYVGGNPVMFTDPTGHCKGIGCWFEDLYNKFDTSWGSSDTAEAYTDYINYQGSPQYTKDISLLAAMSTVGIVGAVVAVAPVVWTIGEIADTSISCAQAAGGGDPTACIMSIASPLPGTGLADDMSELISRINSIGYDYAGQLGAFATRHGDDLPDLVIHPEQLDLMDTYFSGGVGAVEERLSSVYGVTIVVDPTLPSRKGLGQYDSFSKMMTIAPDEYIAENVTDGSLNFEKADVMIHEFGHYLDDSVGFDGIHGVRSFLEGTELRQQLTSATFAYRNGSPRTGNFHFGQMYRVKDGLYAQ